MSEIKPPSLGDVVAYAPCGCLRFAASREHITADTALELARHLLAGNMPGTLTTEEVRAARWSCPACEKPKEQLAKPLPVLGTHPDARAGSKRYHVQGKVTLHVTIPVNGVMIAPDEETATEVTDFFPVLYLHTEDEKVVVEWDDDTLTATEVLPGLPDGVTQEALGL